MKDERGERKHVIPPSVCEEWNLYTKILSLEMPTDTAEREQKPSLAWIMPSREEEKPTLCRINQHSPYARLWHDVGVTPVLLLDLSLLFHLSSFLFHLSSFLSHTLLEKKNNGRVLKAQPSNNQKTIFYKKSIFISSPRVWGIGS